VDFKLGSRQPSHGTVIAPSHAQNPGFIALSRHRAKHQSLTPTLHDRHVQMLWTVAQCSQYTTSNQPQAPPHTRHLTCRWTCPLNGRGALLRAVKAGCCGYLPPASACCTRRCRLVCRRGATGCCRYVYRGEGGRELAWRGEQLQGSARVPM
jgi:hypothetical protein